VRIKKAGRKVNYLGARLKVSETDILYVENSDSGNRKCAMQLMMGEELIDYLEILEMTLLYAGMTMSI
jgi:hypothetical protein